MWISCLSSYQRCLASKETLRWYLLLACPHTWVVYYRIEELLCAYFVINNYWAVMRSFFFFFFFQAHLGNMDKRSTAAILFGGNMALVQVRWCVFGCMGICSHSRCYLRAYPGSPQKPAERFMLACSELIAVCMPFSLQTQALVVALLASVVAISLGWVKEGMDKHFWQHSALLIASSLFTASIASLVLCFIVCTVVYISHQIHVNPDNVATPIAASLGDITTLALMSSSANFLYQHSSSSNRVLG